MNKRFEDMTGRELILANTAHANEPAFRAAFMAAILAGKFQGMDHNCFERIRLAA